MPHQCVRCGKLYEDATHDMLKGCECGAKMFYFIKPEKFDKLRKLAEEKAKLSSEQRQEIETDVYDIMGDEIDRDIPVVLDIESIEVLQPGKYNLDLVKLFKSGEPLIYKLEDGKYFVDIIESFKRFRDHDKEFSRKKRR
ncbi:MAG: Zn-ribbon containing protein [archaeon]